MRTIYKYAIQPGKFDIHMPKGAKVLTVQTQHRQPQMWVLLDTSNEPERRGFVTFPTGGEVPTDTHLDYIGTFQLNDGYLVYHLFEIGRG